MKYPSCYVLLVDDRAAVDPAMQRHNMNHGGLLGHGGLHEDSGLLGDGVQRAKTLEPVSEVTSKTNKVLGSKLVERNTQDSCITAGLSKK